MNIFLDIPYLNEILIFLGVPLFILYLIFFIGMSIYSKKAKKKDDSYSYNIRFYSLLFAVVVCAFLSAISLSFSINFIKDMDYHLLISQYKILYIFVLLFPLFSITFLVVYMVLLFKCHKTKKYVYGTDDILIIDDYEKEKNQEIEVI